MTRPRSVTVIAWLAIAEGIFAFLVGFLWLQVGSIFDQEGGGMSSLIVMMAEARGWALIVLSLLYFLFAIGAWQTRPWAWWIGLMAPVLTLLYLVSVLTRGGAAALVLFGLIVPIIMLWYLLTPQGRQAFGR
jgi:hypothetical protein